MTRRSRSNIDPIGRIQRDLRLLQKEADSPGTKSITTFEDWHLIGTAGQPAFLNGWVNYYPGTLEDAAYWKDSVGIVHLRGLIKDGTVGAGLFTLPVGYRPKAYRRFAVVSGGAFGYAYVGANGGVVLASGTTWVDLVPIIFRAEQ